MTAHSSVKSDGEHDVVLRVAGKQEANVFLAYAHLLPVNVCVRVCSVLLIVMLFPANNDDDDDARFKRVIRSSFSFLSLSLAVSHTLSHT